MIAAIEDDFDAGEAAATVPSEAAFPIKETVL
jgi:hypothetical protein